MRALKIQAVLGFLFWILTGISNLSATPPACSFYEEGATNFFWEDSDPESESLDEVRKLSIYGYPQKRIGSNSVLVPFCLPILSPVQDRKLNLRINSTTDLKYILKKHIFPFHLFW